MVDSSLTPFLNPKGVVVIGVSREPTKLGYFLARNLLNSGYSGAMHYVNPKGGRLFGREIYPTVAQVPDPVDLAVVLVPPPAVPAALKEIGQRGIKASIIATGGFKETGPEGAKLEKECIEIARSYSMRLVGPNCVGLVNTHLPVDTTFLQPPGPPAGEIALISQSGAMCAAVIDWVKGQGFGLSHLLSLGNQADVNETDMLTAIAGDEKTQAVAMYIEMVANGQRFVEQARAASSKKPVVALKVGRFAAGQKAAASHTGALAGSETAYTAAFSRAGILRANTSEELFQWAKTLAWCPLPNGNRVAILTNSGGPGVAASDAVEMNGLALAELTPATTEALKAMLPAAASARNPVDMIASATAEQFAGCLNLLLADEQVDMVLVISPPPPPTTTGAVAKAIIPVIQMAEKPVAIVFMGDKLIAEGIELLRAAKIPEFRFPEAAASALAALWQRKLMLSRLSEETVIPPGINPERAAEILAAQTPGVFMPQEAVGSLMDACGISTIRPAAAATAADAVQAAEKAGYPVVVKLDSPDIPHKSDVGGVILDLHTAGEVEKAFHTAVENGRKARPDARINGVFVQRMLPPGQEVIVGTVRDPQFGPLVMFGSGGVEVEGLKDVAFALAPLSREEAERMITSTWAGKKLNGFRSLPPADRDAVIDVLLRLAALASQNPGLAEIEINPLRVLKPGDGAFAVDIRARLEG